MVRDIPDPGGEYEGDGVEHKTEDSKLARAYRDAIEAQERADKWGQEVERLKARRRQWTDREFEDALDWCEQAVAVAESGRLTANEMKLTNNLVHALDSLSDAREKLATLKQKCSGGPQTVMCSWVLEVIG